MYATRFISLLVIVIMTSCVDRLIFDIDNADQIPIVVSGHISNEPGPYTVTISRGFDTESRFVLKVPLSARQVTIRDDMGVDEVLKEIEPGKYQTNPNGIQGRVGGVYKIRIEFDDGLVYESIADTLLAPGVVDSLYHKFHESGSYVTPNDIPLDVNMLSGKTPYGFDVHLNSRGNNLKGTSYKWDLRGTFESDTQPWEDGEACYPIPAERIPCNFLPPCTGLRNPNYTNEGYIDPLTLYRRVFPCTCCKCWYDFYSNLPILGGQSSTQDVAFNNLFIYRVPLVDWVFMYKVRVEVVQSSITKNTYEYFHRIRQQRDAVNSLFQPVSGKIDGQFSQVEGSSTSLRGIFYAAGIDRRHIYISRDDVRRGVPVPEVDFSIPKIGSKDCRKLFPNSTNAKPDFWID